MSHATVTVTRPAPVREPRGAAWAAAAAVSLFRCLGALFDRLLPPTEAPTAPRSAAALAQLAHKVEGEQPRLAWEVRAIARHLRTFETAVESVAAGRPGSTR